MAQNERGLGPVGGYCNEKGVVEGQVKFTRLNFFVPVPQVRDFTELNARLRQQCVEDRERRLRGQAGTKAELLQGDQAAFLPLPATAFAACKQMFTTASSLSLVRFDTNDYSVPVRLLKAPQLCSPQPRHTSDARRTFRPPFTEMQRRSSRWNYNLSVAGRSQNLQL